MSKKFEESYIIHEVEKCKNDIIYFYENYMTIQGKKPVVTNSTRWILENVGNIQRVWTRKYGYQLKVIK